MDSFRPFRRSPETAAAPQPERRQPISKRPSRWDLLVAGAGAAMGASLGNAHDAWSQDLGEVRQQQADRRAEQAANRETMERHARELNEYLNGTEQALRAVSRRLDGSGQAPLASIFMQAEQGVHAAYSCFGQRLRTPLPPPPDLGSLAEAEETYANIVAVGHDRSRTETTMRAIATGLNAEDPGLTPAAAGRLTRAIIARNADTYGLPSGDLRTPEGRRAAGYRNVDLRGELTAEQIGLLSIYMEQSPESQPWRDGTPGQPRERDLVRMDDVRTGFLPYRHLNALYNDMASDGHLREEGWRRTYQLVRQRNPNLTPDDFAHQVANLEVRIPLVVIDFLKREEAIRTGRPVEAAPQRPVAPQTEAPASQAAPTAALEQPTAPPEDDDRHGHHHRRHGGHDSGHGGHHGSGRHARR